MDLMDCMDNMENFTFSSPFCPLCPLGPQNAGLRQKCAVKKTPPAVSKQSVLQFKNLSGCRKFLPSSNGCKLVKNGYRFVNQRKYLCFCLFMQQRKFFSSTERTFSLKQLQNAPKKDVNLRL